MKKRTLFGDKEHEIRLMKISVRERNDEGIMLKNKPIQPYIAPPPSGTVGSGVGIRF